MRPQRILIVEDHADSASMLSRILMREGHTVKIASCLSDARQSAAENAFDIALCDLGLPDGDGGELVSDLACYPGLKFVALTGFSMADDVARALSVGFHAYLIKPVSFDQLREVLEKVAGELVEGVPLRAAFPNTN